MEPEIHPLSTGISSSKTPMTLGFILSVILRFREFHPVWDNLSLPQLGPTEHGTPKWIVPGSLTVEQRQQNPPLTFHYAAWFMGVLIMADLKWLYNCVV